MQSSPNPPTLNLRSHHSLKNTMNNNNSMNQHMNPLSARTGLTKRPSLTSRSELNATQMLIKNNMNEASSDLKINYQKNGVPTKNQMYISLGNKPKDNNVQFHFHPNHGELETKIQQIFMDLDQHSKRLATLESKMFLANNQNFQIASLLNQYTHNFRTDTHDIKSELFQIKNQLARMMDRKEAEKRIENYQTCIRQMNMNFKNTLNQETTKVEARIQKIIRKQVSKVTQQVFLTIQNLTTKLDIQKNWNNKSIGQIGLLNENMKPLFKNPNFRLKFLSKISVLQATSLKNPQNEQQLEEWVVQQHSCVYMVDKEGFLLDQNKRYIVNENGESIKLNNEQIKVLMGMNLMD